MTVNKVGGSSVVYDTTQMGNIAAVEFNNKYTILQNVQIEISGDKNVENKDIAQGEFVFGLFTDEGCTTPVYVDANDM